MNHRAPIVLSLGVLAVALGVRFTTPVPAPPPADVSAPLQDDRWLLAEPRIAEAHAAVLEAEERHQQRFRDALDPALAERNAAERLRAAATAGDAGALSREGERLFLADQAVDRCAACHHRGGMGGAGGLIDDGFRGLNPPSLAGATLLERAAIELSRTRGTAVRPFGRKGRHATLDAALREMTAHSFGRAATNEEIAALRTWIGSLDTPVIEPPDPVRLPDLFPRFQRGRRAFEAAGCEGCHTPRIVLRDGTALDAFTDLRSHDMGPALADADGDAHWTTPPLWGLAASAPWLHDGRALASLDFAIEAHGGEAEDARNAYAALPLASQGDLKVFLLSLTPSPSIQVAGR